MLLTIGRRKFFVVRWSEETRTLFYRRLHNGRPSGKVLSLNYAWIEHYMAPYSIGRNAKDAKQSKIYWNC